jgi:hypothetical protein
VTKRLALLLPMLILLTACASAPTVRVLEVCPKVPPLELGLSPDALERSFTDRMENFLRGKLPGPTSYALPSGSVRLRTTP